jgi:hypothetical protein
MLRESKIWCDRERHEEKDADALGELRRIGSPLKRTSSIGSNMLSPRFMSPRNSIKDALSPRFMSPRNSIKDCLTINSLWTLGEDAPRTPITPSRPVLSRGSIREFVEHSESSDGSFCPTSDAMRKLCDEVFAF